MESKYNILVVETIKNWMKENAGKPIPESKELLKDLNIPDKGIINYTLFKRRAFKELIEAGFILKYTNELKTVAMVDGYVPPKDIGQKIVSKLLNGSDNDELNDEVMAKEIRKIPEVEKKDKPPFMLYINKTLDAKDFEGIANFMAAIPLLLPISKFSVQLQIKELEGI